jgi:ribulose-phosphate 3-epimerase
MLSPQRTQAFQDERPQILPSLLMCDFGRLEEELQRLENSGVQCLHLDVMDGHFVPNLSYGLPLVETIRRHTKLTLDLHLMIANPTEHDYLKRYRDAGADGLTVHHEVLEDAPAVLDSIRALGCHAGIAINPPTPVTAIEGCLEHCDLVLVMSVMPGFGGQAFDRVALDKLSWLNERAQPEVRLGVDGGVNTLTIADCAAAGAQWMVVGSALFKTPDYRRTVEQFEAQARAVYQSRRKSC